MCGGGFGQVQNFRHNVETGFGIIPKNSPTGKRVAWESDLENDMSGSYTHGSKEELKARAAKEAEKTAENEANALQAVKDSSKALEDQQVAEKKQASADYAAMNNLDAQRKAQLQLLAVGSDGTDKTKTKTITTKSTLLGG